MTYQEKLTKVKSLGFEDQNAHEMVCVLDWMTEESSFLKAIYPQFKKDIDKDATFMEMCMALWNDPTTGIRQKHLINLN